MCILVQDRSEWKKRKKESSLQELQTIKIQGPLTKLEKLKIFLVKVIKKQCGYLMVVIQLGAEMYLFDTQVQRILRHSSPGFQLAKL